MVEMDNIVSRKRGWVSWSKPKLQGRPIALVAIAFVSLITVLE